MKKLTWLIILSLSIVDVSIAEEPPANDCALVATEAYQVLDHVAWKRIISCEFEISMPDGSTVTGGHAMLVWQPWRGAKLHIYDRSGSMELDTASHEVEAIRIAIQRMMKPELKIISAHYWE